MSKQQNISANVQRGLFFFTDFVEVWDWVQLWTICIAPVIPWVPLPAQQTYCVHINTMKCALGFFFNV